MPIANWDDLRLFLAVAREGRMASAARALGLDQSTVARRMDALEGRLGTRLLDRSTTGVRLTAAGQELAQHAEHMEELTHAAERRLEAANEELNGVVRLVAPEAFGSCLVAPAAAELEARHPGLRLDLVLQSHQADLTRREADMAVTLAAPDRGRFHARRLTDYRIGLYASSSYLEQHDPICRVEDLSRHPFVGYIDDLISMPELRYLDQVVSNARTPFRSSSLAAQKAAVSAGLGLGLLHSFTAQSDPALVPVLPGEVSVRRSYWLVVHSDLRSQARIKVVTSFLYDLMERNKSALL
ncbi:LysR family transcriptional regulator [Novosphingobium beihaiensis]|uniref:LysR family transcriptional regulator n=1 Tax=Novosphingobium beihaiensis TaxID=2930389 RepID=A0ABT0BL93_9SPHN|nr:LysR family transcriptional regulator [Novosphingobium beihaiensis]MCJ2185822.1 LysR family transcriptional regulator [Novosphingobium beihaiensis]